MDVSVKHRMSPSLDTLSKTIDIHSASFEFRFARPFRNPGSRTSANAVEASFLNLAALSKISFKSPSPSTLSALCHDAGRLCGLGSRTASAKQYRRPSSSAGETVNSLVESWPMSRSSTKSIIGLYRGFLERVLASMGARAAAVVTSHAIRRGRKDGAELCRQVWAIPVESRKIYRVIGITASISIQLISQLLTEGFMRHCMKSTRPFSSLIIVCSALHSVSTTLHEPVRAVEVLSAAYKDGWSMRIYRSRLRARTSNRLPFDHAPMRSHRLLPCDAFVATTPMNQQKKRRLNERFDVDGLC